MFKYLFSFLFAFSIVDSTLSAQTIINKTTTKRINGHYEKVKEAIPLVTELDFSTHELSITPIASNDSVATFKVIEKSTNCAGIVFDKKELNEQLASDGTARASIYMVVSSRPKTKDVNPILQRRFYLLTDDYYAVIWNLSVKKAGDKQTDLILTYESLTSDYKTKLAKELKEDNYHKYSIGTIAVTNKLLREMEKELKDKHFINQDPEQFAPKKLDN